MQEVSTKVKYNQAEVKQKKNKKYLGIKVGESIDLQSIRSQSLKSGGTKQSKGRMKERCKKSFVDNKSVDSSHLDHFGSIDGL